MDKFLNSSCLSVKNYCNRALYFSYDLTELFAAIHLESKLSCLYLYERNNIYTNL